MKRKLVVASMAAMAMISCQKNEQFDDQQIKPNDGVIRFGTIAPQTRAGELFTNTASMLKDGNKFNVWGIISNTATSNPGVVYLGTEAASKEVTYSASTGEWSYTSPKFWPDANMNFLAYRSATAPTFDKGDPTATPTPKAPSMTWTGYTVGTDVTKHEDLLVAGLKEAAKPSINSSTVLTFKHAMTQVVFSAQLYTGSHLVVDISEVELYNVANQGTLSVTPSGSISDPNDPSERTDGDAIIGWSNIGTKTNSFMVNKMGEKDATVALTLDGTTSGYTYPVTSLTNYQEGAMMMVPQTFAAWDATNDNSGKLYNGAGVLTPSQAGGAFIRVKCKIKDGETGIYLWGAANTEKDIFIPVSSIADQITEWKWGKKINYVITFGDSGSGSGGGGWDGGDPTDPNEPNNPVLIPIKLDAVLTDWDEYGVYLQTVNFTKETNKLDADAIKRITDQLMAEVVSNPAKIYSASIKVTSPNTLTSAIDIQSILEGFLNEGKFKAGSTITFDFGSNNFDFDSNKGNIWMLNEDPYQTTEGIIQATPAVDGQGLYFILNNNGTWTVTKYDDIFGKPEFLAAITGNDGNTFSMANNQEKFSFAGAQYNNGISNWTGNYGTNVTNTLTNWSLVNSFGEAFNTVGDFIILDFTKMKFLANPETGDPISGITIRVGTEFGIGATVEEAKKGGPVTKAADPSYPTYTITKPGFVYIVRKTITAPTVD